MSIDLNKIHKFKSKSSSKSYDEWKALIQKEMPYVSPYADGNFGGTFQLREGVSKYNNHLAVKIAAHHKIGPMYPIHSRGLDHVDSFDWELFHASECGIVDGQEYVWGMFVEGIGAFAVMVPIEFTRELLPHEREHWSRVVLIMQGSHTGNVSGYFPSGVSAD